MRGRKRKHKRYGTRKIEAKGQRTRTEKREKDLTRGSKRERRGEIESMEKGTTRRENERKNIEDNANPEFRVARFAPS